MTKKSDEFEKLNKRIESLVHGAGAVVEWNAKIPDPDSRSDSRQIDVLITANDGRRISVECRDRGGAQSVMWIEELAGRKQSLQLDGMIAVSTNGFSQLAAIKAARFGIVLYDFAALSDEEIASWADVTEVRTRFLQFSSLVVTAIMPTGTAAAMSFNPTFTKGPHDGYQAIMVAIRDHLGVGTYPASGELRILPVGFLVDDIEPEALKCDYAVDVTETSAQCTSVLMRDNPGKPAELRDVSVQRFDHSVREVIAHNGDLHLTIDVDCVICPDNALLHEIEVRRPTVSTLKSYELVGNRRLTSRLSTVALHVVEALTTEDGS